MKAKTEMLDMDGNWIDAVEEPYYPTLLDRLLCFFGFHEIRHKLTFGHIIKSTYYCIKCGKEVFYD